MTQGERVKEIRKAYNLTMEKFGEKLGVGKSSISDIENGRRNLTEQMTKSICREFNVDYGWLTEGIGEMFIESDDAVIQRIDEILAGENDFLKKCIHNLVYLNDDELVALDELIRKLTEDRGL